MYPRKKVYNMVEGFDDGIAYETYRYEEKMGMVKF
jgi:hypothetical protein